MPKTREGMSAKIYQFPVRARALAQMARLEREAEHHETLRRLAPACGSGWYHDAAIEESRDPRKR